MCHTDASSNLAVILRPQKHNVWLWDQHSRFCRILLFLARLSSCDMVCQCMSKTPSVAHSATTPSPKSILDLSLRFPVHTIRHLFTAKSIFVPLAGIAFFLWSITRAHGLGPIVQQPATASGSTLAWGWVSGIMNSIANFATLILNDPDFARFAKKPRDALWPQLFTIPVGFALTSFIGLIVSSSSKVIYGTAIWNPLDLLSQFLLDDGATSAERFGVFVIAAGFVLAQLGTNIAANSVSAGTDMTALLPRYINIRRGGYICAIVGLCICKSRRRSRLQRISRLPLMGMTS